MAGRRATEDVGPDRIRVRRALVPGEATNDTVSRVGYGSVPRMASVGLIPCQAPSRANLARIRTAQLGNREKRGLLRIRGPEPQSPVRMRESPTAKTPRNRGNFSGCRQVQRRSLCNPRLVGGESGIRTHGTFQYTRFPSVRLKPLGHLSG